MDSFACLVYHGLSDCRLGSDPTQYTISFEVFKKQVTWLKQNLYIAEDFSRFCSRLAAGEALPEQYVLLTFDDGYRTNLLAAELLSELGYSATFFLTAEYCQSGGKYLADEDEIQQLVVDCMCSVGTHGYGHRPLGVLSKMDLVNELMRSKGWLEQIVARPVEFMAAPDGSISRLVIEQGLALGYRLVGTSVERPNARSVLESTRTVNRVAIRRNWDMDTFLAIIRGESTFYGRRQVRALFLDLPKRVLWNYSEMRKRLMNRSLIKRTLPR